MTGHSCRASAGFSSIQTPNPLLDWSSPWLLERCADR
jgi:hypothetical protein